VEKRHYQNDSVSEKHHQNDSVKKKRSWGKKARSK
jgi:hypothetical protein